MHPTPILLLTAIPTSTLALPLWVRDTLNISSTSCNTKDTMGNGDSEFPTNFDLTGEQSHRSILDVNGARSYHPRPDENANDRDPHDGHGHNLILEPKFNREIRDFVDPLSLSKLRPSESTVLSHSLETLPSPILNIDPHPFQIIPTEGAILPVETLDSWTPAGPKVHGTGLEGGDANTLPGKPTGVNNNGFKKNTIRL
ncbi:hypothetical protein ABW20_dc0108516 [Dactylellina cionopaga]|nr:hypothetical protein ABW20_dc0108516 [Dactylellina cionopaga]